MRFKGCSARFSERLDDRLLLICFPVEVALLLLLHLFFVLVSPFFDLRTFYIGEILATKQQRVPKCTHASRHLLQRLVNACARASCWFALRRLFGSDDGGHVYHRMMAQLRNLILDALTMPWLPRHCVVDTAFRCYSAV